MAVNGPICSANRDMLELLVPFYGTQVYVNSSAVTTTDKGLLIRNLETGEEQELESDCVILSVGYDPDRKLYDELQDMPEIYAVGDCRQTKNVHQAIWDAYEIANHI